MQSHVLQLAEVMRTRGHLVSVLAPASPHAALPDYFVSGGRAVPIPYNGSVARLRFGPATHRKVKSGLRMVISTYCIYTSRMRRACRCWP